MLSDVEGLHLGSGRRVRRCLKEGWFKKKDPQPHRFSAGLDGDRNSWGGALGAAGSSCTATQKRQVMGTA